MTSSSAAPRVARERTLRGRHVLATFIGFFVTVFAVNGVMVYQALSTFGGLDTPDAYRKGLAYNQTIAREAAQSLAGWQDKVEILQAPKRLRVQLHDRSGSAVAGKKLVATVTRPATDRFDLTLTLGEVAAGIYEAPLPAALEGAWIVDVSAFEAGAESPEPAYQTRNRLWIKP
jgi:nitrogen fixation protein FixH